MTIVRGSHRRGELRLPDSGDRVMDRTLDRADLAALGLDPADIVDLKLEPGDLALWSVYLLHGSEPNTAGGERRFFLNGYVAAQSCDRGEWAFKNGLSCPLSAPLLVHYEELDTRPEPHYVANG